MIAFPAVDRPEVSILMLTYGRWDWASRALEALRRHTPPVYEVVVVDNASPDDTAERLAAEVEGISLIRNETNLGFGGGTNLAASRARGRFLCLLNSDALVREGWYPVMRARLEDPDVGAVGPLFVGEDGTVVEAGAMLGADGVTLPVGRGLDPDDLSVRFPRDVDYGSAACMLVRAEAFRHAGGFSPAYGIGYYEDVDLCLELRALGWRTVYEPGATVTHAVGASSDPQTATDLSRRNRVVFLRRRAADLEGRARLDQFVRFPHRSVHARDHLTPLRVLVVAERLPDVGSTASRLVSLLSTRRPGLRVTVAAASPDADPAAVSSLLSEGVEVMLRADVAWLETRVAHPTVVIVLGPLAAMRFGNGIIETQPQAAVVVDMSGPEGPDRPAARRAEVTMLRRAEAVLAPTPAHARFAREIEPDVRATVASPSDLDLDRALLGVLASVGVDLPAR